MQYERGGYESSKCSKLIGIAPGPNSCLLHCFLFLDSDPSYCFLFFDYIFLISFIILIYNRTRPKRPTYAVQASVVVVVLDKKVANGSEKGSDKAKKQGKRSVIELLSIGQYNISLLTLLDKSNLIRLFI